MSTKTFVYGTVEYLHLEIACETPGVTFTPAEWTGKVSLCEMDDAFDAATATWTDCVLETVSSVHYAKILLGSTITPTAGKYRAFVKLTKTADGTEIPVLKAAGDVVVTTG